VPGSSRGGLGAGLNTVPGVKTSNANTVLNSYSTAHSGMPGQVNA
jgi:hypothetical protein